MEKSEVVSTKSELLQLLRSRVKRQKHFVIGIDGACQAGKTRVSRRLGANLNCAVIECDLFIRNGALFYPNLLDIDCLKSVVNSATDRRQPVIIDSIMLKLVLDAIGIEPSLTVYIRHNWPTGVLTHNDLFDSTKTEAELISEENELCRIIDIGDDEPMLYRQLISYHKNHFPHLSATVIFDNTFRLGS